MNGILRLIAERATIARSIGNLKANLSIPLRAPVIESELVEHAKLSA